MSLSESLNEVLSSLRQKVMMQSFGSACHHLGQPFTVVGICLEMMKRKHAAREADILLDDALQSMDKIRGVLHQMQDVQRYETECYMPSTGSRQGADCRIVSLS